MHAPPASIQDLRREAEICRIKARAMYQFPETDLWAELQGLGLDAQARFLDAEAARLQQDMQGG